MMLQIVGALQLILAGWASYQMVWIRYSPNPDDRWTENELINWFPPGITYKATFIKVETFSFLLLKNSK